MKPKFDTFVSYYQLEKKMTGKSIKTGYYRKSTDFLLSEISRIRNEIGEIE